VAAAKQLVRGLLLELERVGGDLGLAREREVNVGGFATAAGIRGSVIGPPCVPCGCTVAAQGIGRECSRYGLKCATCMSYAARCRELACCVGVSSAHSMIGRNFCVTIAVVTAELMLPLLRTIARSLAIAEVRSQRSEVRSGIRS